MQTNSVSTPVLGAVPVPVARRRRQLKPLEPISSRMQSMLGIGFFVLFVLVWAGFTLGGYVSPTFLASPVTMVQEGWLLFTEYNFLHDIGMTVWRVMGGFVLATAIAVPLGIAMGAYKPVEAFFEPFVSFCRYLPASAFIPLLILWAGIGETQKLLVIFIGSVFQIVLMVAVTVGGATWSRPRTPWGRMAGASCAACSSPAPRPALPKRCAWCWAGPGPTSSWPN